MDYAEGRRLWPGAAYGEQVSLDRRVHPVLHSRFDGHGRFLVHGGPEYSRLHALCKIAKGTNGRAGAGSSDGDDALRVYRRGGHFGFGGVIWRADLGPCRAARKI